MNPNAADIDVCSHRGSPTHTWYLRWRWQYLLVWQQPLPTHSLRAPWQAYRIGTMGSPHSTAESLMVRRIVDRSCKQRMICCWLAGCMTIELSLSILLLSDVFLACRLQAWAQTAPHLAHWTWATCPITFPPTPIPFRLTLPRQAPSDSEHSQISVHSRLPSTLYFRTAQHVLIMVRTVANSPERLNLQATIHSCRGHADTASLTMASGHTGAQVHWQEAASSPLPTWAVACACKSAAWRMGRCISTADNILYKYILAQP